MTQCLNNEGKSKLTEIIHMKYTEYEVHKMIIHCNFQKYLKSKMDKLFGKKPTVKGELKKRQRQKGENN